MDEVVMDEVSLAGQGTNFGATGQPVRGVKRQAESPLMNNAINTKRQRKGNELFGANSMLNLLHFRSITQLRQTCLFSKNILWFFNLTFPTSGTVP